MMNVTVTAPTAASYLTIWPDGSPLPNASSLNFVPGQTVPNLVVAPVGPDGSVNIFNFAGDTEVIVDIVGLFENGTVADRRRTVRSGATFPGVRYPRLPHGVRARRLEPDGRRWTCAPSACPMTPRC